jgi:hypothetical protein
LNQSAREIGKRQELVPWTVAQIFASLKGVDGGPSAGFDGALPPAEQLRNFMDKKKYGSCECWQEDQTGPPHSIVTAWVLLALALYNKPAQTEEIAKLLERQGEGGWWSMYPLAKLHDDGAINSASTAATAWTAFALHAQLKQKLISEADRPKVEDSIKRAVKWLEGGVQTGQARWKEYPPQSGFEKDTDFMAVSALVVYVLRAIQKESRFDGDWLKRLPWVAPDPKDTEVAKGFNMGVAVGDLVVGFVQDSTRHYRYPWMLQTTVDAYARGNVWQRARAVTWLEGALSREMTPNDFVIGESYEDWRMAETLLALRHVLAVVDPGSGLLAADARH